jgi:hypothetical protein
MALLVLHTEKDWPAEISTLGNSQGPEMRKDSFSTTKRIMQPLLQGHQKVISIQYLLQRTCSSQEAALPARDNAES